MTRDETDALAASDTERWELRSARVYGSRHVSYHPTREAAETEARRIITKTGGVGRIECVLKDTRVVHFTKFADDE